MSQLLRNTTALLAAGLTFLPAAGLAANVRGTLVPTVAAHRPDVVGYSRTRILSPGKLSARKEDLVLFLKVKSSLPLPAPPSQPEIELLGYRLSPQIAACAVDGKITFKNSSAKALTVRIGDKVFATLESGESKDYDCVVGRGGDETRSVRIAEWPYARGAVFVGEVGVAGQPNDRGSFSLAASTGKYELVVVGLNGVRFSKEIDLAKADVDLGTLDLNAGEEAGQPGSP